MSRQSKSLATTAVVLAAHLAGSAVSFAAPVLAAASEVSGQKIRPSLVGPAALSNKMAISFSFASRDPSGVEEFVRRVATKGDPLYQHYLTPLQYEQRFGGDEKAYETVKAWARAQGFQLGEHFVGRTVLTVYGTVDVVQKAFGVKVNDYRNGTGGLFRAADTAANLPPALLGQVDAVFGLDGLGSEGISSVTKRAPGMKSRALASGPLGGLSAADLRRAYDIAISTTSINEVVATVERDDVNPADIAMYETTNGLPSIPVVSRYVSNSTPGFDPGSPFDASVPVSVEIAIATNPALTKVIVYDDSVDNGGLLANIPTLAAVASDDVANVVNIPAAYAENPQLKKLMRAEFRVLQQLASQGQTVVAGTSTQFMDPNSKPVVFDPCSQPLVTCVGATTLVTSPGGFHGEDIVYDTGFNGFSFNSAVAGPSAFWPIPSYQLPETNLKPPFGKSQVNKHHRNVPDVAADGDPATGVSIYNSGQGGWSVFGGTGVSTAIWVGVLSGADANLAQSGFARIGQANPNLIYPDNGGSLFDIVNGQTPLYAATTGFDEVSGFGAPAGTFVTADAVLSAAKLGKSPPGVTNLNAVPSAKSAVINWAPVPGATSYILFGDGPFGLVFPGPTLQFGTSATVTGLLPNTSYVYDVYAISPGGATLGEAAFFLTPKN